MLRLKIFNVILCLALLAGCTNFTANEKVPGTASTDTLIPERPDTTRFLYGIPYDSFNLIPGQIKRNGFLSSFLTEHGVSMQTLDMVLKNSAAVFDVRKMRFGNNFTLFCSKDSTARAKYLVYEHDPVTSYIFSFNDSLNITTYRKKIDKEIKYATMEIKTSLWDAMVENGFHPSLVIGLSEIYAWSVDFFGLQKGDRFKVIYEESSIEGKSLGAGRIIGAGFAGSGTNIYAVPFVQGDKESYYDGEGNSLRKAFLKAPLQFARVTSRFSASRMHPILRIRRPHHGVDYAAPIGTPVHAIGDGRVTQAAYEGGSGRMVRIVHNSVYSTAYLHLSSFAAGIAPGIFVKQGDVIGYVGSSGLSTGPHLDFRFYMNGSSVDPLKVEAPSVEPVAIENKARFDIQKSVVVSLLNSF